MSAASSIYELCHGQIHDQPGPRKNVPTAVSTTSSNKNHVMTQYESGLAARYRRKPEDDCGELWAAKIINPAIINVGTSATITRNARRKIESATPTT